MPGENADIGDENHTVVIPRHFDHLELWRQRPPLIVLEHIFALAADEIAARHRPMPVKPGPEERHRPVPRLGLIGPNRRKERALDPRIVKASGLGPGLTLRRACHSIRLRSHSAK